MSLFKKLKVILLIFFITLNGCGFNPLYNSNYRSKTDALKIHIANIDTPIGYELRKILVRHFGSHDTPTHTLKVAIETQTNRGIITKANEITRYNISLNAKYELVALESDKSLGVQEVSKKTGYSSETNVSGYAANTAKKDAKARLAKQVADEIITRLAISYDLL